MTEYPTCPQCRRAEIRVVGVDCPICFQEQRARMQSAGNAYLQRKALEGVESRRAQSHMLGCHTRCASTTNSYQRNDAQVYARDALPPLRKSELTNRVAAHQSFAEQQMKPLKAARAIPLHPVESTSESQQQEASDEDVFFDDAPFCESKYIFLNGEVYRGEKPLQGDRVVYGIDSPMAAVHAAVREAAKRPPLMKTQFSNDDRIVESRHTQKSHIGSSPSQGKHVTEKDFGEDAPSGNFRKFVSSSGRRYLVMEVGDTLSPSAAAAAKLRDIGVLREVDSVNEVPKESRHSSQRSLPHSSYHSRDDRCSWGNGQRENGREVEEGQKSKHVAVPQKPTRTCEDRKRPSRHGHKRVHTHHSSPPGDQDSSDRASLESVYDSSSERLPAISNHRRRKDCSPSLPKAQNCNDEKSHSKGKEQKRRGVECNWRRVDSADSHEALSSCSRSSMDNELPPCKNGHRGRKESDCVVTNSSRCPTHQPRKKRAEEKRRSRRHSSSFSSMSSDSAALGDDDRQLKQRSRSKRDDTDSDRSGVSESSSWSVVFSSSSSSASLSDTSSTPAALSRRGKGKRSQEVRRRRGRHRRGRESRRSPDSSVSSSASDAHADCDDNGAQKARRRESRRSERGGIDSFQRKKDAQHRSRSSSPAPAQFSDPASPTVPTSQAVGGVEQPHQSRPPPLHRPPVVHAVMSQLPMGTLPPLKEEMIASTRYEPACPSPVAHAPPSSTLDSPAPLSKVVMEGETKNAADNDTDDCVSPALGQPRAEGTTSSASNPMRRGYDEIPAELLQLTHFNDLRQPSFALSGPLCSPSQGALSSPPREHGPAAAARSGVPLDLDYITEHVLRVICERLAGGEGGVYGLVPHAQELHGVDDARAKSKSEFEADQRKEEEKATEAKRRRANVLRLRELLRETQSEIRHLQDAKMPLDSLSSSLKFAFAQVTRFHDDKWLGLELNEATASNTLPGNAASDSATLIYTDSEKRLLHLLEDDPAAKLSDLEADTATLERLLKELRERRQQHEARLREMRAEEERRAKQEEEEEAERQRLAAQAEKEAKETAEREQKAAEEAAAAAARAVQEQQEREQQSREKIMALLAKEASERAALRAEENAVHDQLVVNAAKSAAYSCHRSLVAQAEHFENERADLCEAELDARAILAAMEAEEAEDFWEMASRLWQAAADEAAELERQQQQQQQEEEERRAAAEAEEAARKKSAAWQAAQAEEAARLQAELQRLDEEEDAAAAGTSQRSASENAEGSAKRRHRSRTSIKGKLVRSNLIPGQILDVSEEDGKIRLVGDPHVAAVEARLRERRRADRLRQERLAAALPHPPTTKSSRFAGAGGELRPWGREPSTVRVNVAGSGFTPAVRKRGSVQGIGSRASSRRSVSSSRHQNAAGGGSGRLGQQSHSSDISSARSLLGSRSNFVEEGDLDLGVVGQRVGTPSRTRSRASSIASAGVPHMGGIFNVATPRKSRFPDDETDALTSSSAMGVEHC